MEKFVWSLLPSPSTAAGDRSPVLQALVQRDTAWLWWAQAELGQGSSPPLPPAFSERGLFCPNGGAAVPSSALSCSKNSLSCQHSVARPQHPAVPLILKYWEFCMKTTKETEYAEKQSSGEGWMGSRRGFSSLLPCSEVFSAILTSSSHQRPCVLSRKEKSQLRF